MDIKRDFEVAGKEAKKLNEETVFKVYIPNWLRLGANIIAVVAFVGTIGLIVRIRIRKRVKR